VAEDRCPNCGGPYHLLERLAQAEAKLQQTRCHRGHDTLPLTLWDCPACHDITRAERDALIRQLAETHGDLCENGHAAHKDCTEACACVGSGKSTAERLTLRLDDLETQIAACHTTAGTATDELTRLVALSATQTQHLTDLKSAAEARYALLEHVVVVAAAALGVEPATQHVGPLVEQLAARVATQASTITQLEGEKDDLVAEIDRLSAELTTRAISDIVAPVSTKLLNTPTAIVTALTRPRPTPIDPAVITLKNQPPRKQKPPTRPLPVRPAKRKGR
jgi:hypothetical protein